MTVNNPDPVPQAAAPVINVHVQRAAESGRKARDKAQYVRQQKGHSLTMWLFFLGPITLWIPTIYYSFSPNHYWTV